MTLHLRGDAQVNTADPLYPISLPAALNDCGAAVVSMWLLPVPLLPPGACL